MSSVTYNNCQSGILHFHAQTFFLIPEKVTLYTYMNQESKRQAASEIMFPTILLISYERSRGWYSIAAESVA